MIALLQRVTAAKVVVTQRIIGEINTGILVLLGVERDDTAVIAERLLERILHYRMFSDQAGKMNLNVQQVGGGILLVPQFTLAADTRKGLRPGFQTAATAEQGRALFEHCAAVLRQTPDLSFATGQFGADMQVSLTNDGPVTFWLQQTNSG